MNDRSMYPRAGGLAAAAPLLAAILLTLPASTNDSSLPGPAAAAAAARAVEAPAAATPTAGVADPTNEAAQAHRAPVPTAARTQAPARPEAAGMVIGIDPETGRLGMPTREQLKELSDLEQIRLDHGPANLIEEHHQDGSVSVDLQGRFQEFATVRIGPDGKKTFRCVDGAENAERTLAGPDNAPAPARPESEAR